MKVFYSEEVKKHKIANLPILSLESTILAHGMPYPENYSFAKTTEDICRGLGVAPATIAVLDGDLCVGLSDDQLKRVCTDRNMLKLSKSDLPFALLKKQSGATTVSATLWIAYKAGLFVFSTGGIGGVHRGIENHFDVSQDLTSLSNTPVITISSGAKSILDLPKTVEALEALSIPVVGYKFNRFPSFYSRSSNIKVYSTLNTESQVVSLFYRHLDIGLRSSILIVNPIPKEDEIPKVKLDTIISEALDEANEKKISGKSVTPFLLSSVVEKTNGRSLTANISLAKSNVFLGAKIAKELYKHDTLTKKFFRNDV